MADEQTFRAILIAGMVVLVPVAIYFRLRSRTDEKLDRRQEGLFLLISIRLLGLAAIAGLFAYAINPGSMAWSAVPLPAWSRWVGVVLGVAAASLLIWTFRNLGRNLTDTVVTRREHTLVVSGPYRWVRHPFYVAFALAMVANSLVAANAYVFATGGLAFILLAIRSRTEEAHLVQRFGADYEQYRQRTGRFWPRWRGPTPASPDSSPP